MPTTHTCVCGATIEYRQDMVVDRGARSRTWRCRECRTEVPGMTAERIADQHPA